MHTPPGYAIEYDTIDPLRLCHSLEVKSIDVFLAGHINGTSRHEEAACQGLVAGLNAAAKLKDLPRAILARSDSYIGISVDDLVNNGPAEPHQMITSRAKLCLHPLIDNTDKRFIPLGHRLGLATDPAGDNI